MTLSHDEAMDLAGLYVLGALTPAETAEFEALLADDPAVRDEVASLGGVVPALASLAEPVDAPDALKSRVMDAVAREAAMGKQPGRYSTVRESGRRVKPVVAPAQSGWRVPAWTSLATAIAAVLIVAIVGVWALGLQSQVNQADQRAQMVADAVAAFGEPGSSVAVLRPTGAGASAGSGFAAIDADGNAYIVLSGLPKAPQGKTYQAWYIADGAPVSAGLMTVESDGLAVLADDSPLAGTQVVALTLEPASGSDQPTSQPFITGQLNPA